MDQVQGIAQAGGYPFVARQTNVDLSMPFFSVRFGNAVLSDYPIASAWIERFSAHSKLERLFAGHHDSLMTRIALSPEQTILISAVYLESRSGEAHRAAAHRIKTRMADFDERLFITGDFNSSPSGFPFFSGAGTSALDIILATDRFTTFPPCDATATRCTFPSVSPDRTID